MSSGYIYLVHAVGTNLYKIGLTTRTVEARLKELNGKQSPYELVVKYSIYVNDVHNAEKFFHQKYQKSNYRNEWFRFSRITLFGVVKTMKTYTKGSKAKLLIPLPLVLTSVVSAGIFLSATIIPYTYYYDCILKREHWSYCHN
jgi:T5orf172 domain